MNKVRVIMNLKYIYKYIERSFRGEFSHREMTRSENRKIKGEFGQAVHGLSDFLLPLFFLDWTEPEHRDEIPSS